MMKITLEHIKVFNKHAGDGDMLVRTGTSKERELFEEDEWSFIDQAYQDLELINKNLVSEKYRRDSIEKIRSQTTNESFDELTK